MNRSAILLLAVFSCLVGARSLMAGSMDNARFAVHATTHWAGDSVCVSGSDPNTLGLPCSQYNVTASVGQSPGPDVYLVVGQGGDVGIEGVVFGIDYTPGGGPGNGIDENYLEWTACTDGLEFRNGGFQGVFPAPGGGNSISWLTCQDQQVGGEGVHIVVGVFYLYAYSEDVFQITPNLNIASGDALGVQDCDGVWTNLLYLVDPMLYDLLAGAVHFGGDGTLGYTPCGVVSVERTTWGRIKTAYE